MKRKLPVFALLIGILMCSFSADALASKSRTIKGRIYFRNERVHYDTGVGSKLTKINNFGDDQVFSFPYRLPSQSVLQWLLL